MSLFVRTVVFWKLWRWRANLADLPILLKIRHGDDAFIGNVLFALSGLLKLVEAALLLFFFDHEGLEGRKGVGGESG